MVRIIGGKGEGEDLFQLSEVPGSSTVQSARKISSAELTSIFGSVAGLAGQRLESRKQNNKWKSTRDMQVNDSNTINHLHLPHHHQQQHRIEYHGP